MARRLLCIWFLRLASETSLRKRPVEGTFALIHRSGSADHVHCLNVAAQSQEVQRGMALADARAICPGLITRPADLGREAAALRRWTARYSPMVARDGADETRRPPGGSIRPSARHPRDQAKKLFPSRGFH